MPFEQTGTLLGGAVGVFRLDSIADERGALTPLDFSDLPLTPCRMFIARASPGVTRGGHGHREGAQFLLLLSGQVDLELALRGDSHSLRLGGQDNAVLIHAPVWSRQTYLTDDAKLLVLSDTPYDPSSYIYER
jgi:dTDP-4-dehydrorhamnose 3,5-epimerase-like enzyme